MISIQNLEYGYSRGKHVFKNLNLELPDGHIYGLLGKNGIGKTTLLGILAGALFAKGDYNIDGIDPRKRNNNLMEQVRLDMDLEINPTMGINFATKPETLANILSDLYPNFDNAFLEKAIERLEVPTGKRLYKMSMGEQRKALSALSLACNTRYLFMDEPTNGMDITSRSEFKKLVAEQYATPCNEDAAFDKTFIISTHQVDDLEGLIDAVIILGQENVLLCATLEEIGRKLKFGFATPDDTVLYSESGANGEECVMRNDSGMEMPVNTRLLFSAVTRKPEMILPLFNNKI